MRLPNLALCTVLVSLVVCSQEHDKNVYSPGTRCLLPVPQDESSQSIGGRGINLTDADSGKTLNVGVGDTIIIELAANPDNGFCWETNSIDDDVLKQKSRQFETISQKYPEVELTDGHSGETTFTYQVIGPGKSIISLTSTHEEPKKFEVIFEAAHLTSPTVTGKINFSAPPDLEKISRIVVSIHDTELADGPTPLVGTVELKAPFQLPITFAVPYDPARVRPNPMFYSISARVKTLVDGDEYLYYFNDTHHQVFETAEDTKCDIVVKPR